jgi:hypothetical protein
MNVNRHVDVFDPHAFKDRIDVIGAGATGSYAVLQLAKLGIPGEQIHVWDFDKVESHNLANQLFGPEDIGKLKCDALKSLIHRMTGAKIQTHNEAVDGTQKLGAIVFLLTDTMSSRKEIWDKSIKMKFDKKLMIETRMGAEIGKVYTIEPMKINQTKFWDSKWAPDEDIKTQSACGSQVTVGATASMLASLAVWQLIRFFGIHVKGDGDKDSLEQEIVFATRSSFLEASVA